MKKKNIYSITNLLLILGIFITAISYKQKEITEKQAINLAEEFVRINGFTKYEGDSSNIKFESIYDSGSNIKTVLENRHNTLHPKAFCILKNNDSWDIGFLSTKIKLESLDSLTRQSNLQGRVVTMNLFGTVIKMTHKFPKFSNWKKL